MPRWLDAGRLRGVELDRRGARAVHHAVMQPALLRALALVSRLADAPVWLALVLLMPLLDAAEGAQLSRLMLILGTVNLAVYFGLKRSTRRQRPFEQCADIRAWVPPPDAFSFPSGHTLHAVAFGVLLSAFYTSLAPLFGVFALVVSISRVALGLHYPSDVLIGAVIGAATAGALLLIAF